MLWVWIALCFMWQGTSSFMIHNDVESLCLEDSLENAGVQLKRCSLDSELQQWVWTERMFLMNVHTERCLSALHGNPIQTHNCDGEDDLQWQCMNHRLISPSHSLELSVHRGSLALNNKGKGNRWKSLDQGDICQEKLRSRRDSEVRPTMTVEEIEYLRWYYRTEDTTSWKFAMLGLSVVGLILGCMLCVMGMMGNIHRKEIAKYKAASPATVKVELEDLQDITEIKEDKKFFTGQTLDGQLDSKAPLVGASESDGLKSGDIVVTWKDGNVSTLYSDSQEAGKEDK